SGEFVRRRESGEDGGAAEEERDEEALAARRGDGNLDRRRHGEGSGRTGCGAGFRVGDVQYSGYRQQQEGQQRSHQQGEIAGRGTDGRRTIRGRRGRRRAGRQYGTGWAARQAGRVTVEIRTAE